MLSSYEYSIDLLQNVAGLKITMVGDRPMEATVEFMVW